MVFSSLFKVRGEVKTIPFLARIVGVKNFVRGYAELGHNHRIL